MQNKFLIATPLALALMLAGCGQKASDTAASTQNAASNAAGDAGDTLGNAAGDTKDALGNAASDVKEAVTPTPTAQEFIDRAAKSDAFEIAEAKLAVAKAASPDIKAFAKMMITDHTASTAKIKAAAATSGAAMKPDPALTDDQKSKIADLGKLTGTDFDKEYASQQVDAHQTALTLMTAYSDNGDVASLKQAAGEIKPKVQMHLDKIKALKDKLS